MSLIPRSRGGTLWRGLLAAVIVVAFTAAATAVAGLLQFKQLADEIGGTPSLKVAGVTQAQAGAPQTILLIGSDHRAGEPYRAANTDTMLLVHLDASSSTINVISVPRDLRVQLPGSGGTYSSKINAAYSVGGPGLLVKVLKNQVFPGLQINHIVDVNFRGFSDLVDAIGCVYTDVDHRYYNNTALTGYSSIDIQPGYQKLCGANQAANGALAFVRFRHTDSDLVRNARQQDFLRWAKTQFSGSQLVSERDKLVKIFGQNAQTDHDLHTTDGLLKLFELVAFSAGHTIKQVKFPAILNPCGGAAVGAGVTGVAPCYVTSNARALRAAYHAFITPTVGKPPKKAGHKSAGGGGPAAVTADVADGRSQVAAMPRAGMPVYFPRVIAQGSRYCTNATCSIGPVANSYPRAYSLHDQNGHPHAAYRLTLVINPLLGQYYGIQGTTWQSPPILHGTHGTRTMNGKQLEVYKSGQKIVLVAWHTPQGVYWVSNTLTSDLTNSQIVAIAASFTRG